MSDHRTELIIDTMELKYLLNSVNITNQEPQCLQGLLSVEVSDKILELQYRMAVLMM